MKVNVLKVFSTERRFLSSQGTTRQKMKGCLHAGKVKLLFSAELIIDKHQSLFLSEAKINPQHG